MKKPIYLDYNATTPLDSAVLEAMLPFLKEEFGNASSSSHAYGWEASRAVEKSRKLIAEILSAKKQEVIFTSGATESNNLAILGLMANFRNSRSHIITSKIEHKAVLDVVKYLETTGVEVTQLEVNKYGQVLPEQVKNSIKSNTRLISIMMANNEIGTLQPITEIGQIAKQHGVFFHTDAAQSFGKIEIDVDKMGIDLLSISGHKIYGPKGVGALYIRSEKPKIVIQPQQFGGGQEHNIRPGTLNVPGIVGLAKAAELMINLRNDETFRIKNLQKKLINGVLENCPQAQLNGHPTERLCNNVSFSFHNLNADVFSLGLSGLAISSGSACSSAMAAPSYVLKAIGHSDGLARTTLRIGIGRSTTEEDIELCMSKILQMVKKSQEISI